MYTKTADVAITILIGEDHFHTFRWRGSRPPGDKVARLQSPRPINRAQEPRLRGGDCVAGALDPGGAGWRAYWRGGCTTRAGRRPAGERIGEEEAPPAPAVDRLAIKSPGIISTFWDSRITPDAEIYDKDHRRRESRYYREFLYPW
ncbi:MAG: hypothetical protein SWK90_00425 [Chloroflexota bacterium]|nr:hypothetical protein [Chloroflexota bacterium]